MVKEEINNLENTNLAKKPGILAAIKAMFLSDEEKIDSNVEKEVENLKAQSAKNIQALENKILLDKKQEREKLSKDLKPEKVEKMEKIEKATNNKQNEKIKGEEELEK